MKTTQEKIAIMQAFVDGKKIEVREQNRAWVGLSWCKVAGPFWDWRLADYRIAEDMDEKAKSIYISHLCMTDGLRAVINAVKAGEII